MNFFLPIWNPFIVHPLMAGLRFLSQLFPSQIAPGVAGGLSIILFTLIIRTILVPLSLKQVRSQRSQMAVQPELKELQKKFKGDREGMARAQMALYKERGINPAAGCVPLVIQMPVLFGMYSAMLQLATIGLTLDQVQVNQIQPGQVTYAAERLQNPQPYNQWVLAQLQIIPTGNGPITFDVPQELAKVSDAGDDLLNGTQGLTLTPGQTQSGVNAPGTPNGKATVYLRPGGVMQSDGSLNGDAPLVDGQPYVVEVAVNSPQTRVDTAGVQVSYDATTVQVTGIQTPQLQDVPFKSEFLWLRSLGEPDVFMHLGNFGIPGLLLIIMTISSFLSQRMMAIASNDPQQQAMMKTMAFMPLMYLFFFLNTPAGLVLYWLTSNVYSMVQQFFITGLGQLGGDLKRLTGRDFQPRWAYQRLTPATAMATNGVANGIARTGSPAQSDNSIDKSTPVRGQRTATAERRERPVPGKGRKRGKR